MKRYILYQGVTNVAGYDVERHSEAFASTNNREALQIARELLLGHYPEWQKSEAKRNLSVREVRIPGLQIKIEESREEIS